MSYEYSPGMLGANAGEESLTEDEASTSSAAAGGSARSGAYGAAVGGITQGIGSIIQGQMQGKALDFQADVAATNAGEALEQGRFNAMKSQLVSGQRIGAIQASFGANGVSSGGGSAAAILMSSRSNAELDRLNILHEADIKAANFENQASLDAMAANNSRTGGFLGGVSGLISSGAILYMLA